MSYELVGVGRRQNLLFPHPAGAGMGHCVGLSNDARELYGSRWLAAAAWNVGACWYPISRQSI